jgi:LPPG:FO 2-phospho-L-lactate transferase
MILALAGGVGGARLVRGLTMSLACEDLLVAVNVGDDFEHLGLAVSPDLDTVMYCLAGVANPETGWGRADETWNFMQTLADLGGETWFRLGDKDLAVHVERTRRLRSGDALSRITADFCNRLGIRHGVVPVTDDVLRTRVLTPGGELAFQDYFVREQCQPAFAGARFAGAETAAPSRPLADLLASGRLDGIILCPSNPWLSIAPMLAVRALREFMEAKHVPVVAVSPIVAGTALKGPAGKIMRELGLPVSALGVIEHYQALVDGWVIDVGDRELESAIRRVCPHVVFADTVMNSLSRSEEVARAAVGLLTRLRTSP